MSEQSHERQEAVQRPPTVRVVQHAHRAVVQPPRVSGTAAIQRSRGQEHVRPAAEKVVQGFRPRELQGMHARAARSTERTTFLSEPGVGAVVSCVALERGFP